jgi:signal transduction histidine kinase
MFGPGSSRRRGEARLLWQIAAIALPVVVLAAIAVYSLRRDRTAIEQDARRTAVVSAQDLARRWAARATADLGSLLVTACAADAAPPRAAEPRPVCGLVVNGRIRVPPDYPPVPSPPRAPAPALDAEWVALRDAVNRGAVPSAADRLLDLAARSDGAESAGGSPIPDLALLLALRQSEGGSVPDAVLAAIGRRAVSSPSFLTVALVDEAVRLAPNSRAAAAIEARWSASEHALSLLRGLAFDEPGPSARWLGPSAEPWLAFVRPIAVGRPAGEPRSAYYLALVPAAALERVLRPAPGGDDIPGYASAVLRLGDRAWRADAPRGPIPSESALMASATGEIGLPLVLPADTVGAFAGELLRIAPGAIPFPQPSPGGVVRLSGPTAAHRLTVALYLTDTDKLYATYRVRLWLASGLVAVAALAALGGVAGAWRAFERQRRLGELKSNFVASVSHELRAPIAAMQLMSESLERGAVTDEARRREYFRLIGHECRRLASLVENVLDFSRIDRGRREYRFAPADILPIVERTIELMQPSASRRQVTIVGTPASASVAPAIGRRQVDAEALQQALMNIVDNAIKHSPAGAEVAVTVDADPLNVRLSVTDEGPGIPPEDRERIFEPFYRGGTELRRETAGIGIGLSIARHIVEAHGGRIDVESGPGSGSRFVIALPIAREVDP